MNENVATTHEGLVECSYNISHVTQVNGKSRYYSKAQQASDIVEDEQTMKQEPVAGNNDNQDASKNNG